MALKVFVLDEIVAMLQVIGASKGTVENFTKQATAVAQAKNAKELDEITVSSGFGQKSRRGTVDLTLNDQRTQMDAQKAREIGLMLLEAAEAATSDEIFVTLLDRIGITDDERRGRILIDLREIRHGTRGTSWPS